MEPDSRTGLEEGRPFAGYSATIALSFKPKSRQLELLKIPLQIPSENSLVVGAVTLNVPLLTLDEVLCYHQIRSRLGVLLQLSDNELGCRLWKESHGNHHLVEKQGSPLRGVGRCRPELVPNPDGLH